MEDDDFWNLGLEPMDVDVAFDLGDVEDALFSDPMSLVLGGDEAVGVLLQEEEDDLFALTGDALIPLTASEFEQSPSDVLILMSVGVVVAVVALSPNATLFLRTSVRCRKRRPAPTTWPPSASLGARSCFGCRLDAVQASRCRCPCRFRWRTRLGSCLSTKWLARAGRRGAWCASTVKSVAPSLGRFQICALLCVVCTSFLLSSWTIRVRRRGRKLLRCFFFLTSPSSNADKVFRKKHVQKLQTQIEWAERLLDCPGALLESARTELAEWERLRGEVADGRKAKKHKEDAV